MFNKKEYMILYRIKKKKKKKKSFIYCVLIKNDLPFGEPCMLSEKKFNKLSSFFNSKINLDVNLIEITEDYYKLLMKNLDNTNKIEVTFYDTIYSK